MKFDDILTKYRKIAFSEHDKGDPRYILDLIKRIIRVSLETVAIVKTLPPLPVA